MWLIKKLNHMIYNDKMSCRAPRHLASRGKVTHFKPKELTALYQMACHKAVVIGLQVSVARFDAEMRQVDAGHLVCCADAQRLARLHRKQRFACPEHWQGAKQPFAIKFAVVVHGFPPRQSDTARGDADAVPL